MSELKEVLERADRAVAGIPLPLDGFHDLERYRARRRRSGRILALATALVVTGGSLGTLALLRSLDRTAHPVHPSAQQPNSHPSPHASVALPTGRISQRMVDGRMAQRVGPFWFGLNDDSGCVRVTPIPVGPSWTLADHGHDCVTVPGSPSLRIGFAVGQVHRDDDPGTSTEFTAVYGVVPARTATVDVRWSGGGVATVEAKDGRFFLVWSSSERPVAVTARSAKGSNLGSARPS